MNDIKPFTHTPIEAIQPAHAAVTRKFLSNTTRPLEFRFQQLRKLYWGIKDNEQALLQALKADLNKGEAEAYITEIGWVTGDILFVLDNLAKWAKDEKSPDVPLLHMAVSPKIRKDPLGAVLIFGCWNFPVQLTIGPLIGAISAGCTAVIKPSESSPHTARVMQHIIETSLDQQAYKVVQGAVKEASALLDTNLRWDKIFYTGGQAVAKIIYKAAAANLTPVTLELGMI